MKKYNQLIEYKEYNHNFYCTLYNIHIMKKYSRYISLSDSNFKGNALKVNTTNIRYIFDLLDMKIDKITKSNENILVYLDNRISNEKSYSYCIKSLLNLDKNLIDKIYDVDHMNTGTFTVFSIKPYIYETIKYELVEEENNELKEFIAKYKKIKKRIEDFILYLREESTYYFIGCYNNSPDKIQFIITLRFQDTNIYIKSDPLHTTSIEEYLDRLKHNQKVINKEIEIVEMFIEEIKYIKIIVNDLGYEFSLEFCNNEYNIKLI